MRKVLEASPPDDLWNGYGPAEATIYVTMLRMNQEEVQNSRISIGRTFGDTKIFLLDHNLGLITDPGRTGEICIAGPQVSPGYLNRPEENEKSFILVDSTRLGFSSDTSTRIYCTGDLAQWREKEGGLLDYIGRADDQVKISGYRVELGEVSRTIEDHPQVHSCVVRYHRKDEVEFLEAYVIPADWTQHLDSRKLVDWAKEKLPPYMVPSKVFKKRTFPLSANGKVDHTIF
jgi:acyl-CoA synthetase (AMP-forming)/AMP-acid ligase II